MKKICFLSSTFTNNECFDLESPHNRDNFLYFFYDLKRAFCNVGYDLSTHDINTCISSEIVIQLGLDVQCSCSHKRKYLILLESPHVDIHTFNIDLHNEFEKIFTWSDDLIDNQKYFKVNYAFQFPKRIPREWNKKLCCMIAGNKYSKHSEELYSERRKVIHWYQKNHKNEFDLYGTQWDEFYFGRSLLGRIINKIPIFRGSKFPSYKGRVESKLDVLRKYKFSICYENIKNQNGYITEKIFDCFFSGCVPIYWGAGNIVDHVPKNCFIDRREFDSCAAVYTFISEMNMGVYIQYLDAIEDFLNSEESRQFQSEHFSSTIVGELVKK